MVLLGTTRRIADEVPGPERRLTLVVVRTASPLTKPPAGRVAVRVGAEPPGVRVIVGGIGVRVGVAVGTAARYFPAIHPAPIELETGTQAYPPAFTEGPVTVTLDPLEMTDRLAALVDGAERRFTRVVARIMVPVG